MHESGIVRLTVNPYPDLYPLAKSLAPRTTARSAAGVQTGRGGRAPDALTYVSAGIGFCFLTQFGRYAKIVRKELGVYGVIQDTYFSAARDGAPPTAGAVETHVHLESGEDEKFGQEILGMAEQTCFLHALSRGKVPVNAPRHRSRVSRQI